MLGYRDFYWLRQMGIPEYLFPAIRTSWDSEPPALNYGRFDFGFDGTGDPKLFEFNCDTPTSLLEAAVIQWDWKEDVFPSLDQYNSSTRRSSPSGRTSVPTCSARTSTSPTSSTTPARTR
jgi:glutathionylspermidine synthase